MQVTVQEISPVEKKVAIEIEWPFVAAKLDEAYRELGRGVTIRGFRKGKVPRSILEKMFARQVEQEVTQKLVQESFVRAAHEHSLEWVVEPVVDELDLKKGAAFRYSARIEVRASFDPSSYFDVALDRSAPAVTDDEVTKAIEARREDLTQYRKIDGRETLAAGDVVVVDIDGKIGPHDVKRDGMMVELSAETTGRYAAIPGLAAALIGLPLASRDHDVQFQVPEAPPAADGAEVPAESRDISGKMAALKVSVKEAREKLVPLLDDDFAKDTGEAETLDELRGKTREKLLAQKEKEIERGMREDLVKEILRKNPFEVAPALIERQTEILMRRRKMQFAMLGLDPRALNIDENKMREELRPAALDEVRAQLLVDAIGVKENIEVTEADLEKRLAELGKAEGKSSTRLKAELQKEGKLNGLKFQLREEKTLDLLMSRANITPMRATASPSENQP